MKKVLRKHQRAPIGATLAALVFFLCSSAILAAQPGQVPAWKVVKISQQKSDGSYSRGFLLFTTDTQSTGAAFRCEGGRLYAFVAVKPTNFRNILQQRNSNPSDREVSYKINSGSEITEKWVQMFRGQIYMVREISTTRDIFQATINGATITFTRKYKEPVTIPLPVLDQGVSEVFLESCDLRANYRHG